MNKFFYQYWNNDKKTKRLNPIFKYILIAILIAFGIYCVATINYSSSKRGPELFAKYFKEIFKFKSDHADFKNENFWLVCLRTLFYTIQYTALGSLIGFVLAFFSAYLASINLHKHKSLTITFKIVILILRSIPVFFFLALFKSGFDKLLLATLILSWFTWLWLHKYLVDIFETTNIKYFQNDLLLGKSNFKAFLNDVSIRNKSKIIMLFVFSFESNLRWTTILSSAGLIGIGNLIVVNYFKDFAYIGIPLTLLLIVLILLEGITIFLNYLIFKPKEININKKYSKIKRLFLRSDFYCWFLLIVMVAIFISTLFQINYSVLSAKSIQDTFYSMIKPDYSYLVSNSKTIWYNFWIIIKIGYAGTLISFFLSLLIAILGNNKLNHFVFPIFTKLLLLIARIIPIALLFIMLRIIYQPEATLLLIIIFSISRSMSKFFIESINNVDEVKINNFKVFGYSKHRILVRYILPEVWSELITYTIFRFELSFRNLINLGPLSTVGIGSLLYSFMSKDNELDKVSALILPIMISIILIECINYGLMYFKKHNENKYALVNS
ncbi:hypothetical protein [Mycoplasmopsis adleri]|uniref:hypothetical protein n=1 Tax=Mycoplasmopsis adleri TaxID=51362 RepID=UPI003872B9EB